MLGWGGADKTLPGIKSDRRVLGDLTCRERSAQPFSDHPRLHGRQENMVVTTVRRKAVPENLNNLDIFQLYDLNFISVTYLHGVLNYIVRRKL